VPLLVHAEAPGLIANSGFRIADYARYAATRPAEAEVEAIRLIVRLARESGARVHIVHVASAQAADEVARAKVDGIIITAETCPHYLTFAAEDVPDGATELKCAPPIREARHREALWSALARGTLDLVASDHSPAPLALKCPGDFTRAWGGIASLELSLAALWTSAASRQGSALERHVSGPLSAEGSSGLEPPLNVQTSTSKVDLCSMSRWMSEAPARLAGLDDRKGRLAVGFDADLVAWDPDAEWAVEPPRLQQRHKLTPYAGRRLRGLVHTTFVRGTRVWDGRRLVAAGSGQLL
jgi:allantoinase